MRFGLAAAAAMALLCGSAAAQSEADFVKAFAGPWQIVDSRFTTGAGPCRLTLSNQQTSGRYGVMTSGCAAEAELVASWGLVDGQMNLFGASGASLARLGGNQRRMSGNTASNVPMILERIGFPGMAEILDAARKRSGCFYAGFTDRCAPDQELRTPTGEKPRINVLVNLNARSEARDDGSLIGVVPKNTCIQADVCVTATDGAWCRADFDGQSGWLRKLALRQNRWPVVTFLNDCPSE